MEFFVLPAGLIDRYVNKKSDRLKESIKTNSSNLHANDIMGAFRSFPAGEPRRDLLEIDRDLDVVRGEIMELLREVNL